jgi:hypothetical protein
MYFVTKVEKFFQGKRECPLPIEAVICSREGLRIPLSYPGCLPTMFKKGSFLAKVPKPHSLFLLSLLLYLITPQTNKLLY